MQKQLLHVKEVAHLLGVSVKTVLREIGRGRLTALKIGRVWRVSPAALCCYLGCKGKRCKVSGGAEGCHLDQLL